MVNSKAKAFNKRTKLYRKYGASAKKSATTLQAVVRRAVAQSINKNIETKHSCYSNTDGLVYGFELKDEHWLVGYGLDATDGTKRNLPHILGYVPED